MKFKSVDPVGPASPGRRRLLTSALTIALLGCVSEYSYGYEPDDLEVVHKDIRLQGWPREADGLCIGHLSDMHCDSDRAYSRTARAVSLLLREKPDLVVLTGDYITSSPHLWAPLCAEALATLTKVPLGAVAVLGNHDWGSEHPDLVAAALSGVGITVLRNASHNIGRDVWLVGLDDVWARKQDMGRALKSVPAAATKLLLVHEPDYADDAPQGFALQLSGHSHGGQICLPGMPPLHLPVYARHYYEGLQYAKNHPVYTTRGIGTIGPPIRAFCRPEVTVLRIFRACREPERGDDAVRTTTAFP